MKRRLFYAAAVLLVIAAGLASRWLPLHQHLGDAPGDALWAMMVYFALATLLPNARKSKRAAAALAIAYTVELLQLWRAPWLVDLRATRLGHLVLGSAFSLTDLAAYTVGVALAFTLDALWLSKSQRLDRARFASMKAASTEEADDLVMK